MIDIYKAADDADMIVDGYAFKKTEGDFVRVLNLNNAVSSVVIDKRGEVVATNMRDIELAIVMDIYEKDKDFLED